MKSILMIFGLIILRFCGASSDHQLVANNPDKAQKLKELEGKYHINYLNKENVADYNLSIMFDKKSKQVSGFSGCNRFFGDYTLINDTLKFGQLSSTRMFCKENANYIENSLLKNLKKANSFLLSKKGLSLYSNKKLLLTAIPEHINKPTRIEYSSVSKGSQKKIVINKNNISIYGNKGVKVKIKDCTKDYWNKIIKELESIDLKTMSSLEAPSKKFLFDGAPLTRLKITSDNNTVYVTPSFDHGNPHKAIASIVKLILSVSENIE